MEKNKYLLLGSSLGVLALLIAAAVEENFLKQWRRIQSQGRNEEGPIAVQLRQVVNPSLRISDRCVSCHVSMGPGERTVSGYPILTPHKPVVHDPAEYGCTICHGGQGLATEKADAHGDVPFWPQPMLPVRYAQAGCGACHAHLGVPNRERLLEAQAAFERLDCLACHRLDGRGGTLRPDGGGMEGPDLSRAGIAGYDRDWYAKHHAKSAAAASGPWKTAFLPIQTDELELLSVFLATRVAAPVLIEAKAMFHSAGCLGCHKVSGVGGDEGPELTRAGEKDPGQLDFTHVPGKRHVAEWQAEHFRSPVAVVADSQMPPVRRSEQEIQLLTLYVLSLRRRELPDRYLPKDRVRVTRFQEREFATDGATLYGAFCSGCHGEDGMGQRALGVVAFPAIASPDFLELASDEFLAETIRRGRPGRRMPAWGDPASGLRAEEIASVVRHLRTRSGVAPKRETAAPRFVSADVESGRRLFASACSGCHGRNGEGGEGPALNNKVLLETATDTFLIETIGKGRRGTAMQGFLTPSTVRPALSPGEIEAIVAFIRSWERGKT